MLPCFRKSLWTASVCRELEASSVCKSYRSSTNLWNCVANCIESIGSVEHLTDDIYHQTDIYRPETALFKSSNFIFQIKSCLAKLILKILIQKQIWSSILHYDVWVTMCDLLLMSHHFVFLKHLFTIYKKIKKSSETLLKFQNILENE